MTDYKDEAREFEGTFEWIEEGCPPHYDIKQGKEEFFNEIAKALQTAHAKGREEAIGDARKKLIQIGGESRADTFEELIDELDAGFRSLKSPKGEE